MPPGPQQYGTQPGRINRLNGQILAHAVFVEVLNITGDNKTMPKNRGNTIIYRRWLPWGATVGVNSQNRPKADPREHGIQEGVTPNVDTMSSTDVEVIMRQYGCMYGYTDDVADLYEDNIPMEMKTQCGERVGHTREMIKYGVLKGCASRMYAGGTSRATVDEKISLALIRNATRLLRANHAMLINMVLEPSKDITTRGIEPGYLAFCHTDLENDLRDLGTTSTFYSPSKFVTVPEYGSRKTASMHEIGTIETVRFIISPELDPYLGAGATTGTNLKKTSTKNDVYPIIIVGKNAWADLMLRGMGGLNVIDQPTGKKDKADPGGQRGYIGALWRQAPFIQNDGWMVVIEAAVSSL